MNLNKTEPGGERMISRKNLFLLLLAFCLLAVPLWHSAFTVSAQDGSDDALSLLEKDAAKKQLTLGEYLWKMLSGKYPSLGDLAAGSLEKFLEKSRGIIQKKTPVKTKTSRNPAARNPGNSLRRKRPARWK